jgi:hypothetical protein
VSASYANDQRAKGTTEPGYLFARTTMATQASLSSWAASYMKQMPVTMMLLLQERKRMETGENYATGGSFAGFAKSIGLRMNRTGFWKRMDEKFPVLSLAQEKMSMNTRRDTRLVLPTGSVINASGFREFSFDWGYALMRLLSDLPPGMLDGLMKVERKTEMKFTVRGEAGGLAESYTCSSANYGDVGWGMLADEALCDELRRRLNIIRKSTFPCPYEIGGMHSGEMWLSPDEGFGIDELSAMTYDDVLRIHSKAATTATEVRKEEAAQAVAKPKTKKKPARKSNTKRKDLDLGTDETEPEEAPEVEAKAEVEASVESEDASEPTEGLVMDAEESADE